MASDLKLQVILGAVDKITRPVKATQKAINSLNQDYRNSKAELKALQAQQKDISSFRKFHQQARESAQALDEKQAKVRELAQELSRTENPTKKLTTAFKRAQGEASKLKDRHAAQQRELQSLRNRLNSAGISTHQLAAKSRALRADESRLTATISKQKSELHKLISKQAELNKSREKAKNLHKAGMGVTAHGVGAMYLGQAAGRQLLKPVGAFASQETATTDLRVALMDQSGNVGPELKEIIALSTKLGNKLPGNTADFINMMTMLNKQGMTNKAILGGLGDAAAYIAVQLKLAPEQAAEFTAKLQDATRTTEGDMLGLMDVIQRMNGIGVETDNMLGAFKNLGPVMDMIKRQGLDGAKALAPFVVMMDQAGMRGDSAGNAIRKVVSASLKIGKVADANKLMSQQGLAQLDFTDGKGEFGGIDQLMSELDKLKGLNSVARGEVIRTIFGDDAETFQVLSKIIEQGQSGYQEVVQRLQRQADLRQRVDAQLSTLANLWDAATGTFTNTLAVIGEALAPELKALSRWFSNISERIGTFAKENPTLTRSLSLLAGIIAGVLVIGGGLATVVGAIMMTIGALKMMGIAALLFNPVTALIVLASAAAIMLWKNWDGVVGGLKAIWQDLGGTVPAVLKTIGAAILNWSPLGLFYKAFATVLNWFGFDLPEKFTTFGYQLITGLINGIKSRFTAVKDVIIGLGNSTIGWFKDKLGIRSPSRVFAALGDDTMAGLALGLNRGQRGPLAAIASTGKKLAASGALAASIGIAPGALAVDTRPPLARQTAPVVVQGDTITINITVPQSGDANAIARAVNQALDERAHHKMVRARTALYDQQ